MSVTIDSAAHQMQCNFPSQGQSLFAHKGKLLRCRKGSKKRLNCRTNSLRRIIADLAIFCSICKVYTLLIITSLTKIYHWVHVIKRKKPQTLLIPMLLASDRGSEDSWSVLTITGSPVVLCPGRC